MFEDFEKIVAQLDLTGIEPAPAEAGIIVPYEWSKPHGDFSHFGLTGPEIVPYTTTDEGANVSGQSQPNFSEENTWITGSWLSSFILARRAGLKADFPREYDDWQKRPLILMPSPLTSTDSFLVHVHSDFWEKARQYVSQGGALYASVAADAAIPEMESLFGARMVDANPKDDVTIKVVVPFGDLKPGDTFHYSVPNPGPRSWGSILEIKGGTVVAVDQDGRPALVANKLGSGKTLLSAYPIENLSREFARRLRQARADIPHISGFPRRVRHKAALSHRSAVSRGFISERHLTRLRDRDESQRTEANRNRHCLPATAFRFSSDCARKNTIGIIYERRSESISAPTKAPYSNGKSDLHEANP